MPPPRKPSKVVYLRLNPRIADAIHEAARVRGWTLNRWCEAALESVLRKEERLEEDELFPQGELGVFPAPFPKLPVSRT